MTETDPLPILAMLGGTGKEGKGLGYRLAKAGYRILIGSRSLEKAQAVAEELKQQVGPDSRIEGLTNLEAAQAGNIAILTVPYSAHRETLESLKDALQGKILIDVTVPLVPPKTTKVQMPPAGSAAQEAHEILGENVMVTAAFQNISHQYLFEPGDTGCDVLVTGTGKEAREETLKIVAAAELKGWDAGPIENSVVVEGLTSVLLGINRLHGTKRAGIKITGVI
jgi:NADPH-dependent F420 reductase